MRAIGLYRYLPISDSESLVEVEVPTPVATGRDLLVRVHAVSVNPVDTKVRSPKDKQEDPPRILGWDASGVIEAVGSEVTLFQPGEEVYYAGVINRPGSNSEFQLVDERIVGRKPARLTHEEAAALPLTALTAWEALFDRVGASEDAAANEGKSVLLIGGAGGVGSIAIQIAKRVAGLTVIATASREDSAAWCRQMGADHVIDHRHPFRDEFARLALPEVDYILCFNSTEHHIQNMADVIRPQGRICSIAETKGNQPINMNVFQSKSVQFGWELMFTRALYQTPDLQRQHDILNQVSALVDVGTLQTTMTTSFGPLTAENLRRAHAEVETGRMIGKGVLGGMGG